MADIYLGLAAITGLALLACCLVAALARRLSNTRRNLLATGIVAVMVFYSRSLWQSTFLTDWLPVSNLIIVGNWFPLFLAALGGVVLETKQLSPPRRAFVLAALAGFAGYASLSPLLGRTPDCSQRWTDAGECVQTTPFTCSPASAATLLRLHGIATTEQEMAELCLTRHGTSWLGLYRGLKLKTQGTPWDVEIVRCSADEVPRHADRPMIAEAGLEESQPVDAAFRSEFGWTPGMRHSVVLAGFAHRHASIIDPSPHIGREEWDEKTLKLLWRGYGLRLVERAP